MQATAEKYEFTTAYPIEAKPQSLSSFSAYYKARELSNAHGANALVSAFASSNIEIYPYQIAAAGFALRSPYLKGVLLADECSLGKTYEALLVATQMWYEGKTKQLLILPVNMVEQWLGKIKSGFSLPFEYIESDNFDNDSLIITTYDYAVKNADKIKAIKWDLVIFDEADCLNKSYDTEKKTARTLKYATDGCFKLLLTPTPIEVDIRDIYGLIYFIDETVLPMDIDEFYKHYFRHPERYRELAEWVSKFCFRTLKSQVSEYVNFTERVPYTLGCDFTREEKALYDKFQHYLALPQKQAFPKQDQYDLTMQYCALMSSSAQAFAETFEKVISRLDDPQEISLLQEVIELAKKVNVNGKMKALTKLIKQCFTQHRRIKANKKAIIFANSLTTQAVLRDLLTEQGYGVLIYSGANSRNYSIIKRFRQETDIQILVCTDAMAKGLDIEFCPLVINYDMLSNATKLEQRISRCHRQGQKADVFVVNMLNRENFADVRTLELVNKRALQFDGIFGMSDNILGNFDEDSKEVLAQLRHTNDIQAAFAENLEEHEQENVQTVEHAEDMLFTTFTREIANKVKITPQYIKGESERIKNELWELTKWYFSQFDGAYEIDDNERTATLKNDVAPPKLFTYMLERDGRAPKFETHYSNKKYGMNTKNTNHQSVITLTSHVGSGILRSLPCENEGTLIVDAKIEDCAIGLYAVNITESEFSLRPLAIYYVFVGRTKSGQIISHDECKKIIETPILYYIENIKTSGGITHRHSFEDRDGFFRHDPHFLDEHVPKDDFLKKYIENQSEALQEEISTMKRRANVQKVEYERTLDELRRQIKKCEENKANVLDRITQMKAEKELTMLNRELREREEKLFMNNMCVDLELEKQIDDMTKNSDLVVKIVRHYVVEVSGK